MEVETKKVSAPSQSDFLDILLCLVKQLKKEEVRYCHWKSNYHLNYALAGVEDWDVLIHVEDFHSFMSIITSVGFKPALTTNDAGQFGVYHFYGLDDVSGNLVHIHAYSRILSGDSLVKSYCLPVEEMLLDNLRCDDFMPVPFREADLLVFLIRNALKSLSPLDIYMQRNDSGLILEELNWLFEGLDDEKFKRLQQKYFPELNYELLRDFSSYLKDQQYSYKRYYTAWKISNNLKRYRRMSSLKTQLLTLKILLPLMFRKFVRKTKYMRSQNGGKIVVLIGPQAVGKSTVAKALTKWIGQEFDVTSVHVGKPPATLLTTPFRLLLPLLRKLLPSHRSTEIEKKLEKKSETNTSLSLLHIIRKLILAYERKKILRYIFRKSIAGKIMICDRYPSQKIGAVDGASFTQSMVSVEKNPFKRFLMKLETKIYDSVNPPDLIFSLAVDVNEAVRRAEVRDKVGPRDPEYVKFRHGMKVQPEFSSGKVVKVNTGTSIEETIKFVKKEFWKAM